jgi:peptide/nickel transport system substrate-binding protein
MLHLRRATHVAVVAVLLALGVGSRAPEAAAQTLTVALAAAVTSVDPHFHNTSSNNAASRHLFDTLIRQDPGQRLRPGLAVAWRAVDPTTWEFELRPGVRFHDGASFTADDVVASIARAANLLGSPSSFALYTRAITAAEATGPLRLRLRTAAPHPLLPVDLSLLPIMSVRARGLATSDLNQGHGVVGTGPFKLVAFEVGDRMVLARDDGYWDGPSPWAQVVLRFVANGAARATGLLSGAFDLIEAPTPTTLEDLARTPGIGLSRVVSNKVVFLFPDHERLVTPFVTDHAGRPLDPNPLRDPRVRRALDLAIDRQAIVDRVLRGEGVATGQILPAGLFGHVPNLPVTEARAGEARELLAEAGLPHGFALTLHTPNDRFLADEQIAQSVAQMLARVGVRTQVVAMPWATFAGRSARGEFSLILIGWGAGTGEASSPLRGVLASPNRARGWGIANRGRWRSPGFDALLDRAMAEIDDEVREDLLRRATELAIGERAILPLHHEMATWAHRASVRHQPRVDQYTTAMDVTPASRR